MIREQHENKMPLPLWLWARRNQLGSALHGAFMGARLALHAAGAGRQLRGNSLSPWLRPLALTWLRHVLRLGLLVCCAMVVLYAPAAYADEGVPTYEDVRQQYRSSETWLLDRSGQRLQRLRTDFSVRQGDWIALSDMSAALLHAIVLSEDQNFYAHSGVDWAAVSSAAWGNLWNERTRGASTITMQLAGLLDPSLHPQAAKGGRRSWMQKLDQALLARQLEKSWSKAQILEAYLNLVPLRAEMVGLDALSLSLFGKKPFALDARESAVAAALVRAPNAKVATVARRACHVLQQAQSPWGEDCKALEFYTQAALQRRSFAAADGDALHFARYALQQYQQYQQDHPSQVDDASPHTESSQAQAVSVQNDTPTSLQSTINGSLQRFVDKTLKQHLREITAQNVQDGAVLVLDNQTGDVLAWVGSSGAQLSRAAQVDSVLALRQPGSTLKPFLYAQAIAQKRLTAASLLNDSPARIPTAHGLYVPQNYDMSYKGWVSVRLALASSLNIPAVRTLVMVSPDDFAQQLLALGLPLTEPAGYYGYSLALGGVDVSLLSLTNAYRAMANGGQLRPIRVLREQAVVETGPQVLDAGASFIVSDILADRYARATTFGTDSHLATRFWSAVKTGTSKDMRDNWAMGYTSHYTIGVWVGNADGSPMHDVSGVSGAAPVWAAIAGYLQNINPSPAPAPPPTLVRQSVTYSAPQGVQLEASRQEWFLPGTAQTHFVLDAQATTQAASADEAPQHHKQGQQSNGKNEPIEMVRITQPTDGTILAMDPDIPPENQLLRVSSNAPQGAWFINGAPVSPQETGRTSTGANPTQPQDWFWIPKPGRFVFELRQAGTGKVLDSALIEVRGAELMGRGDSAQ